MVLLLFLLFAALVLTFCLWSVVHRLDVLPYVFSHSRPAAWFVVLATVAIAVITYTAWWRVGYQIGEVLL